MGLRFLVVVVLLGVAWAGPAHALSLDEARHLLARTGFGTVEPDLLRKVRPLDRAQAVDLLLNNLRTLPVTPPPRWVDDPPPDPRVMKTLSPEERQARRKVLAGEGQDLKAWWVREMVNTPSPLTERMVLFWHNHFTSALNKVHWPGAMFRQNTLFRRLGTGDFASLLKAVATDPAMLIYLDGRANRVGEPNENFARELMELFTLGADRGYTEDDVRQGARALTGWVVDPATGQARFMPRRHDDGVKLFLGQSGRFDTDDVIRILLAKPRTADFIAGKFWRAFVSDRPDRAVVHRWAADFRTSNYAIKPLLREILLSQPFWDPANRGALTKSPVDIVVGTLRLEGERPQNTLPLVNALRALGQDLLNPPNVKGWPGGATWINAATLPLRHQILSRLGRGLGMGGPGDHREMAMAHRDRDDRDMDGRHRREMRREERREVRQEMQMRTDGRDDPASYDRALEELGPPRTMVTLLLPVAPEILPAPDTPRREVFRALLLDPRFELK